MQCINKKCRAELPPGAIYCPACGLTGVDLSERHNMTFEQVYIGIVTRMQRVFS